jgi:hypothetical protein
MLELAPKSGPLPALMEKHELDAMSTVLRDGMVERAVQRQFLGTLARQQRFLLAKRIAKMRTPAALQEGLTLLRQNDPRCFLRAVRDRLDDGVRRDGVRGGLRTTEDAARLILPDAAAVDDVDLVLLRSAFAAFGGGEPAETFLDRLPPTPLLLEFPTSSLRLGSGGGFPAAILRVSTPTRSYLDGSPLLPGLVNRQQQQQHAGVPRRSLEKGFDARTLDLVVNAVCACRDGSYHTSWALAGTSTRAASAEFRAFTSAFTRGDRDSVVVVVNDPVTGTVGSVLVLELEEGGAVTEEWMHADLFALDWYVWQTVTHRGVWRDEAAFFSHLSSVVDSTRDCRHTDSHRFADSVITGLLSTALSAMPPAVHRRFNLT